MNTNTIHVGTLVEFNGKAFFVIDIRDRVRRAPELTLQRTGETITVNANDVTVLDADALVGTPVHFRYQNVWIEARVAGFDVDDRSV